MTAAHCLNIPGIFDPARITDIYVYLGCSVGNCQAVVRYFYLKPASMPLPLPLPLHA